MGLVIGPNNTCILDLVAMWYLLTRKSIRGRHSSPTLVVGHGTRVSECVCVLVAVASRGL